MKIRGICFVIIILLLTICRINASKKYTIQEINDLYSNVLSLIENGKQEDAYQIVKNVVFSFECYSDTLNKFPLLYLQLCYITERYQESADYIEKCFSLPSGLRDDMFSALYWFLSVCFQQGNYEIVEKYIRICHLYRSSLDNPPILFVKLDSLYQFIIRNDFVGAEKYYNQLDIFKINIGFLLLHYSIKTSHYDIAEKVFLSNKGIYKDYGLDIVEIYLKNSRFLDALKISRELPYDGRNILYRFTSASLAGFYNEALDTLTIKHFNYDDSERIKDKIIKYLHGNNIDYNTYNNFVAKIVDMFSGKIEPVFLTEQISEKDNSERLRKLSTVNYFIGLKYDMEGSPSIANQYYMQVIAIKQIDTFEYHLAQKTLQNIVSIDQSIDQKLLTIAVVDFEANGFNEYEANIIANRIASKLVQYDQFIVLERAKMDLILNEQGFQLSGCTSNDCVVEVGQLLGVQLMLAGSIGRFGNINTIELRIIDIETGKIIRSANLELYGEKELVLTQGVNSVLNILMR